MSWEPQIGETSHQLCINSNDNNLFFNLGEGCTDVHIIMLHNLDILFTYSFVFFNFTTKKDILCFKIEDQLCQKLLTAPLKQNTDCWFGQYKTCFRVMEATNNQLEWV